MTKDPSQTNDFYIRLSGKANIPKQLEIGQNYDIKASGTVTSKTETDKNDGTHIEYFKFEPVIVEVTNERGESIKARDIRSNSARIRSLFYKKWANSGAMISFDDAYDQFCNGLMRDLDVLIDKYLPDLYN